MAQILIAMVLSVVFLLAALPSARAQQFPNFVDPSARAETPDFALVPALRFLTSPDFPPFNFLDDDKKLVGFHIDLSRALCEILQAKCTIQSWPWDQAAEALNDNQGDAFIGGLSVSELNAERFDFTDIYLQFPARLVTTQAKVSSYADDSWKAARIAVRKNSTHEKFLEKHLKWPKLIRYATEIEALEAVSSGKAEVFFGDGMRAAFWMNARPDCCAFVGEPFFDSQYFGQGLAIAVPRDLDTVRHSLNWALAKLSQQGILEEFYLRWFPISFY